MADDKNEIVPKEDDNPKTDWESWLKEYESKHKTDLKTNLTNYSFGEKTPDIKLNQIINLLWIINERLDKIEEKLDDIDSTTCDTNSYAEELYDEYCEDDGW